MRHLVGGRHDGSGSIGVCHTVLGLGGVVARNPATAGKDKQLPDWTVRSCSGAVGPGYGAPRRGRAAGTGRATTRAGARRVQVVCELGEGWEGWKIVEEIEVGVLEPSTEGAGHPPKPFITVYFWEHVRKNHS